MQDYITSLWIHDIPILQLKVFRHFIGKQGFHLLNYPKMPYYAVAHGREKGIYSTWDQCKANIIGFSNARYKKFNTKSEAMQFINGRSGVSKLSRKGTPYASPIVPSIKPSTVEKPKRFTKNSQSIYVDGACRGNGKSSLAKSGYGVYYGENDSRNEAVPLSRVDKKPGTNQRAELHALNHALTNVLKDVESNGANTEYVIYTDSKYTMKAATEWSKKWAANGWKTSNGQPVQNKDLIEPIVSNLAKLDRAYKDSGQTSIQIAHVPGHSGNFGNERADQLANRGADLDG